MDTSFAFRARDAQGQERQGVRQGTTARAVAQELVRQGLTPLDVQAVGGGRRPVQSQAEGSAAPPAAAGTARPVSGLSRWRRGRPRKASILAFGMVLRELAALLKAGVPLMRALRLAGDNGADAGVRAAVQRIAADLDGGLALTQAIENERKISGLVTRYDVAMVQVGERTGRLPECFADMHQHREFQLRTQQQVASALRYPMFVVLTCLIAMVVVTIWVIPSFAKVFAAARTELPLLTRLLLGASRLMLQTWPALLGASVLGIFGWHRWVSSDTGRLWWDRTKLRLPIVGRILLGIQMSRLAAGLASGLSAGLTLNDALLVTGRTLGNRYVESRIQQMCSDLARGTGIGFAARNMGVLPTTMAQMFAIGEESGSLDSLMREIGLHYQSEVDHAISKLAETIEPLMIWVMGLGVLVLALGIFMPMWDLGGATLK